MISVVCHTIIDGGLRIRNATSGAWLKHQKDVYSFDLKTDKTAAKGTMSQHLEDSYHEQQKQCQSSSNNTARSRVLSSEELATLYVNAGSANKNSHAWSIYVGGRQYTIFFFPFAGQYT